MATSIPLGHLSSVVRSTSLEKSYSWELYKSVLSIQGGGAGPICSHPRPGSRFLTTRSIILAPKYHLTHDLDHTADQCCQITAVIVHAGNDVMFKKIRK